MVEITLTAKDPEGGAIANGEVVINGHVVYGTDYSSEQWNQVATRTADGKKHTYSNGVNIFSTNLIVKGVVKAEGKAMKDWLREKVVYGLNRFDIALSQPVDLGEGETTSLLMAEFPKPNDEGVFSLKAPGIYNINFPFEKAR